MNYGEPRFDGGKDDRFGNDSSCFVLQVAVGADHAALLTDEGVVYTWGTTNEFGQLGRDMKRMPCHKPSPVVFHRDAKRDVEEIIVQIACGDKHCMALTQDGRLHAWGSNQAGQLGVEQFDKLREKVNVRLLPEPCHVLTKNFVVRCVSCGPESTACTTKGGEVFVWGAAGFYFIHQDGGYGPNEAVYWPTRLRSVPGGALGKSQEWRPDKVSLYSRTMALTIARSDIQGELENAHLGLKTRQAFVQNRVRTMERNDLDKSHERHKVQLAEMALLQTELEGIQKKSSERVMEIDSEVQLLRDEIERLVRNLTVYEQQDTMFTEQAENVEVKKIKLQQAGSAHADTKNLEACKVELEDTSYFKEANRKQKVTLLEARDHCERNILILAQERTEQMERKDSTTTRLELLRGVAKSGSLSEESCRVSEGLEVALAKFVELKDTELHSLAGAGNWTGFREVYDVSNRALMDVGSALKEVSSRARGSYDGEILETVLENIVRMRQERNQLVWEKFTRIEAKPRPDWKRRNPGSEDLGYMFFAEAGFNELARQLSKDMKKPHASSRAR